MLSVIHYTSKAHQTYIKNKNPEDECQYCLFIHYTSEAPNHSLEATETSVYVVYYPLYQ